MSYILDALKRSEEERNQDHIPTLRTTYYKDDDYGLEFLHSTAGRIMIIALLVAIAALLYSNRQPVFAAIDRLFGDEPAAAIATVAPPGDATTVAASTAHNEALRPTNTNTSTNPNAQPAPSPPTAAVTPASQQLANAPRPTVETAPTPVREPPVAQTVAAIAEPTTEVPQAPTPVATTRPEAMPVATAPAPAAGTTGPDPEPVTTAAAPTPSPTETSAADTTQADDSARIKTKHDLPMNVRQSLPKVALNVVAYSSKRENRFVVVNAETFYEGDEIVEDYAIESITPDGPIVNWRGHAFLLKP